MDVAKMVGWYDDKTQSEPAHKPPPDVACPICSEPLGDFEDASWVSLHDGGPRSYFYGLHQECKEEPRVHIDEAIMMWIDTH